MDLNDPKIMLQQMCSRLCKRPVEKADIVYNPARVQSGGTQATVKLNCLQGQEFAGEVCASSRDAEKSAAQQALQFFMNSMDSMQMMAGMPVQPQARPPRPRMANFDAHTQQMLAMAQGAAGPFGQAPLGQVAMGQGVLGQGFPQGFGQSALVQGPGPAAAFGMPVTLPPTQMNTRTLEAAMGGPRGPPRDPRGPAPPRGPQLGSKGPSTKGGGRGPMAPGGGRPQTGAPKGMGGKGAGPRPGGKAGGPGGPKAGAPKGGAPKPAARAPAGGPLAGSPGALGAGAARAATVLAGASPEGAEANNMNMETSKSSLNVACMKILKRPMQKGEIVYDSPQVMGGFKSTVRLPCLPGAWAEGSWSSEVCASRKAAEQDAAAAALSALEKDPELGAAMSEVSKPAKKSGTSADGDSKPPKGKGKGKGKREAFLWSMAWWAPRSGPDLPREKIGEEPVTGTVVEWKGAFGWLKPSTTVDHPLASRREGKVYVHKKDLSEGVSELETGATVRFTLYSDSSGLGAEAVSVV